MIPYGRQSIDEDDIAAVIDALRSDFLTQGPLVPQFEKTVAGLCGVEYAVAVNSATSALHLACLALNVGPGDIVWTSPITFVASANCALYCGADIDFVDIEPDSGNMCVQALEDKLERAARQNRLPKVVIPVHFAGQPCRMSEIFTLSQRYGFKIIEDASHAIGASCKGRATGACDYSDITIFSFHPVKIITTAEGGIATTKDGELARKMSKLRQHGIVKTTEALTDKTQGDWYYEQDDLGFNYRMTELQAALGLSQTEKLSGFIKLRHQLAATYDAALKGLALKPLIRYNEVVSAFHLYVIQLDLDVLKSTRKQMFQALRDKGVGVQVHYIPVHLQPFYKKRGFKGGSFPKAERFYEQAITLPLFPTLTEEKQRYAIQMLKEVAQ